MTRFPLKALRCAAFLLTLAPVAACAQPADQTASVKAKRFAKLDTNGDGMLNKSEIDAMLARRFKKLDTDGDGVASAAERAAAHAHKGKASDS